MRIKVVVFYKKRSLDVGPSNFLYITWYDRSGERRIQNRVKQMFDIRCLTGFRIRLLIVGES